MADGQSLLQMKKEYFMMLDSKSCSMYAKVLLFMLIAMPRRRASSLIQVNFIQLARHLEDCVASLWQRNLIVLMLLENFAFMFHQWMMRGRG